MRLKKKILQVNIESDASNLGFILNVVYVTTMTVIKEFVDDFVIVKMI